MPRLALAVYGTTQPAKLVRFMREGDDGLLGRILWAWPEPIAFRLGRQTPCADWAIAALDRLRELELRPGDPPRPIPVPLAVEARGPLERLAQDMQEQQAAAEPFVRSALTTARGQVLRLSLVLELLWCCGEQGISAPPTRISSRAFTAAAGLVSDYFLGTARRVYGETPAGDRNAATLARWIMRSRPAEVHVRDLQRVARLAGLRTADQIRDAAQTLVAARWLQQAATNMRFGPRARLSYTVNPRLEAQIG